MTRNQRWIITGPRSSGKTSCLQTVIADLQSRWPSITLQGLLSPGVFQGDDKIAIDLVDIASGASRRLAERNTGGDGPETKHWSFHRAAINWGNRRLRAMPAATIFIMDELGPLELERGQGFQAALTRLDQGDQQLAVVVIRPELIGAAQARWKIDRIIDLEAHPSPREAAKSLFNTATHQLRKDFAMHQTSEDSSTEKLAFVSDDGRTISSHFGRARQYVVIRLQDGEIAGRETREKYSPHGQPEAQSPEDQKPKNKHQRMTESIKDCQLVVARGMGQGARHHLEAAGLEVLLTDKETIDEAVTAYLQGVLADHPDRLHHGHGHHN